MIQKQLAAELPFPHLPSPLETMLRLSSQESVWRGVKLKHYLLPPWEINQVATTAYTVSVQLSPAITIESSSGDRRHSMQFVPDDICVSPTGVSLSARWQQELEIIVVGLEPEFMAEAVQDQVDPDRIELMLQLGGKDPFIKATCLALRDELQQGCPGGSLYGETLGTALGVHLVTHYATSHPHSPLADDELPSGRLSQVLDYINAHLDGDIRLSTLAAMLDMSPFYFCHLFKRLMGISPHQYVILQRVDRAKLLLKQRDRSIADIALECGFGNQSHLTKQFKKQYGITPKKYRDQRYGQLG